MDIEKLVERGVVHQQKMALALESHSKMMRKNGRSIGESVTRCEVQGKKVGPASESHSKMNAF